VSISIRDAHSAQDRRWIQAHYPEYLDDLSPMGATAGSFAARSEYAARELELTAPWFMDEGAHPLVILKDERPVGFALVSRPTRGTRASVDFRLVDFFVALDARRLGVGRDAARLIFSRFAGRWELSEALSNKSAVTFWRTVLADYTGGKVREVITDGEVRQFFESVGPRPVHR
jgi:predicted acetyltransferase